MIYTIWLASYHILFIFGFFPWEAYIINLLAFDIITYLLSLGLLDGIIGYSDGVWCPLFCLLFIYI